jgi:hypothetical protein
MVAAGAMMVVTTATTVTTLDNKPKIKDKLVAVVARVGNGHGKPQDRVLALGVVDRDEAVAKGLARDDVLLENPKVKQAGLVDPGHGHDAAGWTLGYDFCSFFVVISNCMRWVRGEWGVDIPSCGKNRA